MSNCLACSNGGPNDCTLCATGFGLNPSGICEKCSDIGKIWRDGSTECRTMACHDLNCDTCNSAAAGQCSTCIKLF